MLKLFDSNMNEITKSIIDYQYELLPLDNFSPFGLIMNEIYFPTSEHAFQYLKYIHTNPEIANEIKNSLSPYQARIIAHQNKLTRDPNWSKIKYEVMKKVIRLKVQQNPMVKEALINTEDYLICELCIDEDTDWGIDKNNNGENHLGKILMEIRKELTKEKITLEEYKEYLLNYYRYAIDSTPEKRKEREIHLKRQYSDETLKQIINDTYSFAKDVLNSETIKHNYCSFEIEEDKSFGINLFISGGGSSDYIYVDSNNRLISRYILHTIFGEYFSIEVKEEEIERECEEDVLSYDYHYSLYMQGFPNDIEDIKERLFKKEILLSKKRTS